jgi:hypothetical protein
MVPNLNYLQIRSSIGYGILESNENWNDFMASFEPPPTAPPPSPATLAFFRDSSGSERLIKKWNQYFDFSSIQALDIGRIEDISGTASFLSGLRKLERLFIDLDQPYKPISGTGYWQGADYRSIFGFINPLKCLRVRGLRDKSAIFTIVANHGKTLQGLFIEPGQSRRRTDNVPYHSYPVLGHDDILQLAKEAPGLRTLRLTLERSEGDLHERKLYEALGAFLRLHILILDLHYRHEGEGPELGNLSVTNQTRLKEAFVNAAMDESLAVQIWDIIYSKQNKEKLRKLRLVPYGWDLFPSRAEREILLHLSRSVLISKRGYDYGLEAVEIGREETLLQAEREEIATMESNLTRSPPKRLRKLIQSLWKLSESELEDWTRHWRSFSLNVNNDETT